MAPRNVHVARVYDVPGPDDGARVLVDRLWPRGLGKQKANLDEWCKQVAPSSELRVWYGHDPERYAEFSRRYRAELDDDAPAEAVRHLGELADRGALTLLTAARRFDISEATVLADLLNSGASR